ncbi:MFS transporter [Cellulomonas pakistanensis]|uniref:MFS transporter n=1 Tax=Cellulomonas pakistanensis TaxID=992287 RepID=A0A919U665_9CELL|nr:MFS transporter [Cellulomonas pakistanensis]GIG35950.1 MFS transporter [Cellulomonas pakistanensis]
MSSPTLPRPARADGTRTPPVTASAVAPPAPRASVARHRAGFWLVAAAFLATMAFSTAPAPLYPLYQAADGFSTFTVTIVFAAYAVGVALALVLAGHVSDWLGRRRVLLPAIALELVAGALFLSGTGLATLLVARFVSGLGVGMLTATATAHLHELHAAHRPGDAGRRPQVVAVVANIGGLGLGALVAGALAETGVAPLRLPYLVFVVLLLLGVAAVLVAPETVRRPAERPAYRPQRPRRTGGDPAAQLLAYTAAFASFAVFGVFTSVAPGFVGGTLHHASRLLAGLVVFVVFGAAAGVQAGTTRVRPATRLRAGVAAEAAGLVVLTAGMLTGRLDVFLVGGVVTGAGAGLLFAAGSATVAASAAPAERGEALAGLFLVAYLGLSLPAMGLGLLARVLPQATAMALLSGVLLVLLGALALGARRTRR